MSILQTIEFDLDNGYTDEKGVNHKHVVMREMTTSDQIKVANDQEVKILQKNNYSIDLSSMKLQADTNGVMDLQGNVDPINMFITQTAVAQLNTIIFTQTVLELGDLKRPINREIFRNLKKSDLEKLQVQHNKLNELDLASIANKQNDDKGKPVPLS